MSENKVRLTTLKKDYEMKNANTTPRGEPIGICSKCGKEFEQKFSEDRNSYSDWDMCEDCRKKQSKKQEEQVKKQTKGNLFNVKKPPYTPFPWQEEAAEQFEKHRFIVLSCGNRCG